MFVQILSCLTASRMRLYSCNLKPKKSAHPHKPAHCCMDICRLPWAFHLRLLSALCNDLIEGGALKTEIAARVDAIASLHAGHRAQLAEVSFTFEHRITDLNSQPGCLNLEQFRLCCMHICGGLSTSVGPVCGKTTRWVSRFLKRCIWQATNGLHWSWCWLASAAS